MHTDRALRLPQVSAMTGLARSTIYALVADGKFPAPFKLTAGSSAWLESSVQKWLKARAEAPRDRAQGCLPAPALDEVRDVQCAMQVLDEWYEFSGVPAAVRPLLTAWLVATLQPNIVTPILEVSGPPGSGKTILAAHIQQLIDPGATPGIRSARLRPEDIAAAAATFYTVGVDNVSRLSADESDLLCQVSTGATLTYRRLYEQRSTVTLSVKRPVILTSIAPVLVRSDAADRAVVVELPARQIRVDETEVNASFEAMRPRMLAAVHRALAAAMGALSDTSSSSQHRLAGFVRLGRAIAIATGKQPATFDRAMDAMKRRQAAGALDEGSLGGAILEVVQQHAQRAAAGDFLPPTRENLRKQAEAASMISKVVDARRRAVLLTGEALRRDLLQAIPELAMRGSGSGLEVPRTARSLWEVLLRLAPYFVLQLGPYAVGVADKRKIAYKGRCDSRCRTRRPRPLLARLGAYLRRRRVEAPRAARALRIR